MYFRIGNFEIGKRPAQAVDDAALENLKSQIISEYEEKSVSSTWNKLFSYGLPMTVGGESVLFPMRQIASVYKAITAICDNVPQAGFAFYTADGQEIDEESIESLPLVERMNRPNARQSWHDFIQEWAGFYALYGEAFIRKSATVGSEIGRGLPEFYCLSPAAMKEQIDRQTGQIVAWKYTYSGGSEDIPVEEIVHSKSFNPYNPNRGLSPLAAIEEELEIDQASLEFNNAFFKNDATPNFILSTDQALTAAQVERLTKWWQSRYGGKRNAFKPAVFEKGLKPSTIANTHKDMDFIEQKRFTREEILGIWKTPKALFNITDDLNYATFAGQMKAFWIYCLMPILRKFEDSFNAFVVRPYNAGIVFKFDLKNVPAFQEDFAGKVTTAKTLWDMGFTADEINEKLDLGFENADWRREWWVGFGQVPASQILSGEAGSQATDNTETQQTQDSDESDANDREGDKKSFPAAPKRTAIQSVILKGFGRRQTTLERAFEKKMNRYLYELRRNVLATPDADLAKGIISGVDWEKQDDSLLKYTKPLIGESIKQGIEVGRSVLNGRKSADVESVKIIADELLSQAASSYLAVRADKIKIVNRTLQGALHDRIRRTVAQSIGEGQTSIQTAEEIMSIGSAVRTELKNFFNDAGWRAKLIARTETCGAMNGGSHLYYENQGVEKKEWLTAGDEFVRESHRECEAQGAIPMDKNFSNGLAFPADMSASDPAEICNCRCTLAPILSEE